MSRVRAVLEAFAVGDAMGMPTEFMTRSDIRERFGLVDGLLPASASQNHSDLATGSVTDDTEQNLYLIENYRARGGVDVGETASTLLRWVRETGAVEKRYIGPSSRRALERIEAGDDPATTGLTGTTCGGVMRVPAAVLWNPRTDLDALEESIVACLMPTHYTSEALEAAGAYAFALRAALGGGDADTVLAAGAAGGKRLIERAPYLGAAPSSVARILAYDTLPKHSDGAFLDALYGLWGTGLPSADVCGAAFAIFQYAAGDTWRAIRLGASVGADTDTIAALAGGLTAACAGSHNIPEEILQKVLSVNGLNADAWTDW